ncbi:MAG: hypothetical protein AMXMBFR12_06120 [Candidatus Babeliales bacterium]
MRAVFLIVCLISISLHSMEQSIILLENSDDSFFKELRMQLHEDPKARLIVKTCGGILTLVGFFRPMTALSTATVAGLASLLVYWQDRQVAIQERKKAKDTIAFAAFTYGPKQLIEKVCQADEYEQTDARSLQRQNTPYLIEILKNYIQDPHNKYYEHALYMLKKHHANFCIAQKHFKNTNNQKELEWLAHNSNTTFT